MFEYLRKMRLGKAMDYLFLNTALIILTWLLVTKLVHDILISTVVTIILFGVGRITFFKYHKLPRLLQVHQHYREQVKTEKELQKLSPTELVQVLCDKLGIQQQKIVKCQEVSWGQYYLEVPEKKLLLGVAQAPGQTIGAATVIEFTEYARNNAFNQAYFLTTGDFSPGALNYAQTVELVGLVDLRCLALWVAKSAKNNNLTISVNGIATKRRETLREELGSFNRRKAGKFLMTGFLMFAGFLMLSGAIKIYFLIMSITNLLLAVISLWQVRKQKDYSLKTLEKLQMKPVSE